MNDMENSKKTKPEIPNNPFDEVDDYDDWIYEDGLIDDMDVIIPPKETQKDSITMNFRKQQIEKESEKLSNQMIDEFTKWYEDLNFKKSKGNPKIS